MKTKYHKGFKTFKMIEFKGKNNILNNRDRSGINIQSDQMFF